MNTEKISVGVRFPAHVIEGLKRRAAILTLIKGRTVTWASLLRAAAEDILSEPEPEINEKNFRVARTRLDKTSGEALG